MANEKYIELGPSASSLVSAANELLTTRDRSKQSLISCSQDVCVGYAIKKLQSEYGRARQRALVEVLNTIEALGRARRPGCGAPMSAPGPEHAAD
jgi:hypothetical protein